VDLSTIRVYAEVLESAFGTLEPGIRAQVRFAALPGKIFEGTVAALSPEVDPSRGTGVAYIELPNPDGRIKPGMYAEVELFAAIYEDRLAIPRAALLERDRRLLVFAAKNGRAEWQYVETGLETDESIEITSGIAPGDTILVEGHLTLAHAAPVRVSLKK
jgi:Cu(I)/Ag(I) efflux system membrane fusion protein